MVDRHVKRLGQFDKMTLPSGELGDLVITSMKEHFDRDITVPANVNVAQRIFHISEGRSR